VMSLPFLVIAGPRVDVSLFSLESHPPFERLRSKDSWFFRPAPPHTIFLVVYFFGISLNVYAGLRSVLIFFCSKDSFG